MSRWNKLAKDYFKKGNRIKILGNHVCVGLKFDAYYLVENDVLKIYCEETKDRIDILTDLCAYPAPYRLRDKKVWYHSGFLTIALFIKCGLDHLLHAHDKVELYGYSLGSGWGMIFADMLQAEYGIQLNMPIFFATPGNVWFKSRFIKNLRKNYITIYQGFDIIQLTLLFMRKYGQTKRIKGRGNPVKSHDYHWLKG